MADIFYELFPDETRENGNNQAQFRFNRGGPFGGLNRGNQANAASERTKKKGRVVAVADQRTSSLIVSAASELMPQIAGMIEQLDASTARKQKVFVYSLENADVQQVEQIVRDMFERTTTGNQNANQNSTLGNRSLMNDQSTPGAGTAAGFNQQGGLNQGGGQLFR
jgi:type II secretory pathway component GspD/PulD (secretin)